MTKHLGVLWIGARRTSKHERFTRWLWSTFSATSSSHTWISSSFFLCLDPLVHMSCSAEILKSLLLSISLSLSFPLRLITRAACCCLQNNCANVFIFNKDIQHHYELKTCTFLCAADVNLLGARKQYLHFAACGVLDVVYLYTYRIGTRRGINWEMLNMHLQLL